MTDTSGARALVRPECAAVYGAEDTAAAAAGVRRYTRFAELEAHIQTIVASDWWDERFADAPHEVRVTRRSRTATYSAALTHDDAPDGAVIAIVDGRHWSAHVALHELAHLAAGNDAGHGPAFRAALIALWRREAGLHAAIELVEQLRRAGFAVDLCR